MNRSIAQKILLVFILVTLMGAGALAQSGGGTPGPSAAQRNSTVASGYDTSNSMTSSWQANPSYDCPYHRSVPNVSSRNAPVYGID
jgi:hypothetical protein